MKTLFLVLFITLVQTLSVFSQNNITPVVLEYGANYETDIAVFGEVDLYHFEGKSGDIILLRMRDETRVDAFLKVYDPDGELVVSDWSDGGLAQIKDFRLDKTGTYTIEAFDRNHNDIGNYGISLHKLNNNTYATPLPELSSISDIIDEIVGVNAYRVNITAGDVFFSQMRSESVHFECDYFIYDKEGNQVFRAVNKGRLANVGPVQFDISGEYTIFIMDRGGNDRYPFGFSNMLLNRHQTAKDLNCIMEESASVSQLAEYKYYRLTVPHGKAAVLDFRAINPRMEAKMEIFDQNGNLIASKTRSNQLVSLVLEGDEEEPEEPELEIVEKLNLTAMCLDTDRDELIWRVTNPNSASVNVRWVVHGTPQTGTYPASPGKSYFRTDYIPGSPNTTKIFWFNEEGKEKSKTKAHNNSPCDNGTDFENDGGGQSSSSFLVLLSDRNGNDFSDYGIQLQYLDSESCLEELNCENGSGSFNLNTLADSKAFIIKGVKDEQIQIELKETEAYLEPHLRLYDATGTIVAEDRDGVIADLSDFTFPYTGNFYVLASDMSGNDIGALEWKSTASDLDFEFPECVTVYHGFEPLCGAELSTGLNDINYTFEWSTGENTSGIYVCPSESTTYSVIVENEDGCSVSKEVFVEVVDVTCGNGNNVKIQVCHVKNNGDLDQKCISENGVWDHLNNGNGHEECYLGPCEYVSICDSQNGQIEENAVESRSEIDETLSWITPNPTDDYINVFLEDIQVNKVELRIINIQGTTVYQKSIDRTKSQEIQISLRSLNLTNGVYNVFLIGEVELRHKPIIYIR